MATRKNKKSARKTASRSKKTTTSNKSTSKSVAQETMAQPLSTPNKSMRFYLNVALVVLLGLGMFMLAKQYRGLIIAGTVNKSVITRWQLNQTLTDRYGEAVLEELVNNELLRVEAQKEGITVTEDDIKAERQKLVENLGGEENLQSALVQYGLTEPDLNEQIRLRLLQERLAEKKFDVTITDEEIKTYFEENKTLYEGKKLEEVQEEIKDGLYQQKLQQEFLAWFNGVKESAQINTYID